MRTDGFTTGAGRKSATVAVACCIDTLAARCQGSALDLVMSSLYFDDETPEILSMQAADEVEDTGLGYAIPLYIRFQARNKPIVGTSIDYFDFRKLQLAQGRMLATLGESVGIWTSNSNSI